MFMSDDESFARPATAWEREFFKYFGFFHHTQHRQRTRYSSVYIGRWKTMNWKALRRLCSRAAKKSFQKASSLRHARWTRHRKLNRSTAVVSCFVLEMWENPIACFSQFKNDAICVIEIFFVDFPTINFELAKLFYDLSLLVLKWFSSLSFELLHFYCLARKQENGNG